MLCHYAECRILFIIMLDSIVLGAIMLNVVMLSVVAPNYVLDKTELFHRHVRNEHGASAALYTPVSNAINCKRNCGRKETH
jgi:hypothetical protein